jgi:DNA modification methylase
MNEIIQGDALKVLRGMVNESVNSIITSPPYFNLRDYGVDGQIGLEKTWQEYIKKLIDIFNEAKRVLKKDGTCFVNLGDTYQSAPVSGKQGEFSGKLAKENPEYGKCLLVKKPKIFSDKCLMLIPERFAISMVDNGWILRNKLVWIKRNAMPESVQDRWKKAHEYIFFFVKSKKYYFNLDAIRTQHKEVSIKRAEYEQGRNVLGMNPSNMGKKYLNNERYFGMPARMVKLNEKGACPPDFIDVNTNCSENDGSDEHYATYPMDLINPLILAGSKRGDVILDMFNGSGTTCVATKRLNRNFIGIELNKKYCDIANQRLRAIPAPLL